MPFVACVQSIKKHSTGSKMVDGSKQLKKRHVVASKGEFHPFKERVEGGFCDSTGLQ